MDIKSVRKDIFRRDGEKCYRCGNTELLCLDHIIPKPQFQIHTVDNMLTLCLKCNFKKGIRPLSEEEFIIVESYVLLANKIFSEKTQYKMNYILKEYFTNGDGKPKNKKGRRRLREVSLKHYEESLNKQP
jgi:hypothetical protein